MKKNENRAEPSVEKAADKNCIPETKEHTVYQEQRTCLECDCNIEDCDKTTCPKCGSWLEEE